MNICMLSDMVKKEKRMPLIPNDIIELKKLIREIVIEEIKNHKLR